MIAIKFSPKYEDRVSIFLKNTKLKIHGIEWDFKETPGIEDKHLCYWLIDYKRAIFVNTVLSTLREMKNIMGIEDLEFQYCYNLKEFYTQSNEYTGFSNEWFKV
mgnify:CR=1 FL=1